jgi:hypothetical protein
MAATMIRAITYKGTATFDNTIKPLMRSGLHVQIDRLPSAHASFCFFLETVVHVRASTPLSGQTCFIMYGVGLIVRSEEGARMNVDCGVDLYWFSAEPHRIFAVDIHKDRGWGTGKSRVGDVDLS